MKKHGRASVINRVLTAAIFSGVLILGLLTAFFAVFPNPSLTIYISAGFAGIALYAVSLLLCVKSLTRPIRKLAVYAKEIANGNFYSNVTGFTPSADPDNKNEIEILKHALIKMVHKLGEQISIEEKHVEERTGKLLLATNEAEQAKKHAESANEIKRLFLAKMSQEINVPMNAILNMTELLAKSQLGIEQQRYTNDIQSAAGTLLDILNSIIDFSKLQANELELDPANYNFPQLLENMESTAKFLSESKALDFQFEITGNVPASLYGDKERLRQILTYIISNAVKFTEKGYIKVKIEITGNEICFSITDTGIGIRQDEMNELFEPFNQDDMDRTREKGGTGLGLAISHSLAKLMGGRITAESLYGLGSTFSLFIPIVPGENENINGQDFWQIIKSIPQLNIETGLERVFGQKEVYKKLLGLVVKEIAKCQKNLAGYLQTTDMHNFRIDSHGIKGSLANIGAMDLSAKALELETASAKEDMRLCGEKLPAFLASLENFKEQVENAFALDEPKKAESEELTAEFRNILEKLKTAFEDSDFQKIDEGLTRLKKQKTGTALAEETAKIKDAAMIMDYPAAVEIVKTLLK